MDKKFFNEWKKMRILHSLRDYTRPAPSLVTYASLHVFAALFN